MYIVACVLAIFGSSMTTSKDAFDNVFIFVAEGIPSDGITSGDASHTPVCPNGITLFLWSLVSRDLKSVSRGNRDATEVRF